MLAKMQIYIENTGMKSIAIGASRGMTFAGPFKLHKHSFIINILSLSLALSFCLLKIFIYLLKIKHTSFLKQFDGIFKNLFEVSCFMVTHCFKRRHVHVLKK